MEVVGYPALGSQGKFPAGVPRYIALIDSKYISNLATVIVGLAVHFSVSYAQLVYKGDCVNEFGLELYPLARVPVFGLKQTI